MNDKLSTILSKTTPSKPDEPVDLTEDDDCGPCAAIAKSKWITALTIRHTGKPWESFQYKHVATRSVFTPTRFEVRFVDEDDTYRVTVS